MLEKELEKRSRGDVSGNRDGRREETVDKETGIHTEGKGYSPRHVVVCGLKVGVCQSSSRKRNCGRIDSYYADKKHYVEYEVGKPEDINLTGREFVLESASSEFPGDPQVNLTDRKPTKPHRSKAAESKATRRCISGKKPEIAKRGQRFVEETAKVLLTRTPAATFKSVELDDRTSAKVIMKRVKVYSSDKEGWLTGRIISYNERRRHHLVAFEDGNMMEMDLQAQWCMVELRYEEATELLNSSSHEFHCF